MYSYDNFLKILADLIQFFKDANILEQEKLNAAQKNRVTFVEECMKKEQVIILKLRGFDKTREEIQRDLGFEGLTFKEILAACTEDQRSQLSPLFRQLSEHIKTFEDTFQCARDMIEINLHNINQILSTGQGNTIDYGNSATARYTPKNLTNRTI